MTIRYVWSRLLWSYAFSPGSWCTLGYPPRVAFLCPSVLWSFWDQASLSFKTKWYGGSSSCYQIPRPESLMWDSELSLLWENLCGIYVSVCVLPTQSIGVWLYHKGTLPTIIDSLWILSLDVEYLFWQVPVFFVNSSSAVNCDFGVFLRGELISFLLCHLASILIPHNIDFVDLHVFLTNTGKVPLSLHREWIEGSA